jgi:hypothetical protein
MMGKSKQTELRKVKNTFFSFDTFGPFRALKRRKSAKSGSCQVADAWPGVLGSLSHYSAAPSHRRYHRPKRHRAFCVLPG